MSHLPQSGPAVVDPRDPVENSKEVAFTTRLEDFVNWGRKNSLWPLPFGTACCAIEYMSVVSSHYDASRFGAEVVRFSPRQADCMLVLGTVVEKMGPVLRQIYDQMLEPKWVIAVGVCASSGGFYRAYHVLQGIDEILPVDVYVPGCPPTPEGIIYGLLKLQEKSPREALSVLETATNLLESKLPALLTKFKDEVEDATDYRGDLEVVVKPGRIREIVGFLKHDLGFNLMMDLFGMDYLKFQPSTPERFAVIYNMYNLTSGRRVRLKVFLSENSPEIDSLCEVFKMANWFEREAWDMYGIVFKGHPHLVRILCHHEFVGHPMRKDYPADRYQRLKSAAPSTDF